MCRPLFRVVVVPCVFCFFLLFLQQRCLSAALKPAPALLRVHDDYDYDDDNNNYDDDDDVEDGASMDEVVRVAGRDKNISRIPHQRVKREVDPRIAEMEERILKLEKQMMEPRAFAAKQQQQEKCAGGSCPVGAMKYGCECLMFVHKLLSWHDARGHCESMTGKLVSVTSSGAQKYIKKFLKAQLGRRGLSQVQVFTGLIFTTNSSLEPSFLGKLSFQGKADGWYWRGLRNVSRIGNYSNWAENQPPVPSMDTTLHPSCMHLEGRRGLQWVTTQCNKPRSFICHFRAVSTRGRKRKKAGSRRRGHNKKGGDGRKSRHSDRRNGDEEERENG